MRNRGLFVCIEGLDQSGKKTQVELLIDRLRERGLQVEYISFPDYNTRIGEEIRAFLSGEKDYNVQVRHILYAANRWERKEDVERWLNEERKIVIVNRYYPSNLAYGLANGLNLDWLLNLDEGLPKADLVIVIDISPESSFKRKLEGRDLYERDISFLMKVRQAYTFLSQKFKWIVLDGEDTIQNIHNNIWNVVREVLFQT